MILLGFWEKLKEKSTWNKIHVAKKCFFFVLFFNFFEDYSQRFWFPNDTFSLVVMESQTVMPMHLIEDIPHPFDDSNSHFLESYLS